MNTIINLEKEKDFLSDSIKFYDSKNFSPNRKIIKVNFSATRTKPAFDEDDFLDHSGAVFKVVQQIYLIGLAEYKTELTFEQFLYFAFWNTEAWERVSNRHRYLARHTQRHENRPFRKPHKFQQKRGLDPKVKNEEEETKITWREHKKIDRDKSKRFGSRRSSSYGKSLKTYAIRRERRYVKQKIQQGQETDSKISKVFFDNWFYD